MVEDDFEQLISEITFFVTIEEKMVRQLSTTCPLRPYMPLTKGTSLYINLVLNHDWYFSSLQFTAFGLQEMCWMADQWEFFDDSNFYNLWSQIT